VAAVTGEIGAEPPVPLEADASAGAAAVTNMLHTAAVTVRTNNSATSFVGLRG
jgi:hypothetical protein